MKIGSSFLVEYGDFVKPMLGSKENNGTNVL